MKTLLRVGAIVSLILVAKTFGQTTGDFQTHQTGNWNDVNTWERWDGALWVTPSPGTPDSGSGKVSILTSHTVTITADVIVDSVFVNTGGMLVVNAGDTVTVGPPYLPAQAGISVSGTMIVNGIYKHARLGGSIPAATWNTGSTCLITAATSTAPSNGNQNFYNLTWNCPGQTTGLNLGMVGNTIGGNVRVINSAGQAFRLTASTASTVKKTITINGDALVDSSTGYLTATGSSGNDTITVILKGSIISKGIFQLANGSGAMCNWYVGGNINSLGGTFTTNSTATKPDSLFFNGTTKQTFIRGGGAAAMSNIYFRALPGAIVDLDTNSLGVSTATTFTLDPGATLNTGHPLGLDGNLNNGGVKSLSSGANYTFNGSSAQVTGALLPSTVNNLTINNAAGVTLSKTDTVAGALTLTNGLLKIGTKNLVTNAPGGDVTSSGGGLKAGGNNFAPNAVIGGSTSSYIVTDSSGTLTVNAVGSTQTIFPVGTSAGYAPVWITNTGDLDTFTVAAASDTLGGTRNGGGRVKLKWSIAEKTSGGSNVTLQLGWVGSKEDALFSANRSMNAKIYRLSDTTQIGSGSYTTQLSTEPYTVSRSGVTSFGIIAVGNFAGFVAGDGDYRSHQSGPWSNANTWERNNGATWVFPATVAPSASDSFITIQSGHVVNVSDSVFADQITLNAGGTLKIDSAKTLALSDGTGTDLTVLGTIVNAGTVNMSSGGTTSVGNGGTFEHAQNGGVIPVATWNTGSLFKVTGTTAATSFTSGGGQNFYNIEWNCPAQTANTSMGLNGATVSGFFKVVNTNTGRVHCFGSSSGAVTINGDVIVQGGNFAVQGTSSASNDTVKHYGNINVTGGNFSISRGSQGGAGTTTWYLYNGNMSLSNATTQNSTTTTGGGFAKFVFAKAGTQTCALSGVTFAGTGLPLEVSGGTTLSLGTSIHVGTFTLNAGATLESGNVSGLDAAWATTGTKTLSKAANYTFNGLSPQVTGALLPDTVNNLTIKDTLGVRLSSGVTVNGALTFMAGKLSVGSKNLTAPSIVGTTTANYIVTDSGGSLKRYPVGATQTLFPVGTTEAYSPVWITNAGTVDTFTVSVAPDQLGGVRSANGRVKLKWNINEKTAGGSNAMLQFGWSASQEDANFTANRAGNALIVHLPDTLHAGTGAYTSQFTTQPYTLSRGGFTSFGTFAVGRLGSITSVGNSEPGIPKEFSLEQNYPNPFNPSTVISYDLPKESRVSLKVYSMLGQEVATLVDEVKQAGTYTVIFSAQSGFASGVYFYRIQAGDFVSVKKMMMVK